MKVYLVCNFLRDKSWVQHISLTGYFSTYGHNNAEVYIKPKGEGRASIRELTMALTKVSFNQVNY